MTFWPKCPLPFLWYFTQCCVKCCFCRSNKLSLALLLSPTIHLWACMKVFPQLTRQTKEPEPLQRTTGNFFFTKKKKENHSFITNQTKNKGWFFVLFRKHGLFHSFNKINGHNQRQQNGPKRWYKQIIKSFDAVYGSTAAQVPFLRPV